MKMIKKQRNNKQNTLLINQLINHSTYVSIFNKILLVTTECKTDSVDSVNIE